MEPRVPNHRLRKDEFVVPEDTDTPVISEPVLEMSEDDRTSPEREDEGGDQEEEEDDDIPDAGAIEEEPSDASEASEAAASEQASSSSSGDDEMVGHHTHTLGALHTGALQLPASALHFARLGQLLASDKHSTNVIGVQPVQRTTGMVAAGRAMQSLVVWL